MCVIIIFCRKLETCSASAICQSIEAVVLLDDAVMSGSITP